ncbi:MAG: choice-of-anchor J domain-containing protein [Bacteroidales bacterium]|nr:choice-of-anchor J domain-containing protein [Bacteroidales bacterium]
MKKRLLLLLSALVFAGMTVAQDIYSSGYYTNSSNLGTAAVYKNGTKLYESAAISTDYPRSSSDVDFYNGDVYWVVNCKEGDAYRWADIYKNNSVYLSSPTGHGRHINALVRFHDGDRSLWSVGAATVNGVKTAVRWRNDETDNSQLGNGTYESEAYGACTYDDYVYSCGYQNTNSSTSQGVIWKGRNTFTTFANGTKLYDIAYFSGYFYVVGTLTAGSTTSLKVWRVSSTDGAISDMYTLSTDSEEQSRFKIYVDAGDVYVNGRDGSPDKVWKNGDELYTNSNFFTSVVANTNGVYYAGSDNGGKIWKDGSLLYSLPNCIRVTSLYINEPTCTNSDIRSLPFAETFENGSTSWHCWTKLDVDEDNGMRDSYWMRGGKRVATPATGDYCARHTYGPSGGSNQEGWLISPQLFLQPGRDNTTLTFKTYEASPGDYEYEGVWVSTNSDPTATSAYTQVWTQSSASETWKEVTVDLSSYQGQAVYIAFKYTGTYAHAWYIDDVSVTESWDPCSTQSVPYSQDFSSWNWQSTCWYNVDYDLSGGGKHWKYDSSEDCAYHPWGQQGVDQYGCLVSPNITLQSGKDYVLKFKTMSTSSGSNMENKIWILLDGTGTPNPDDYLYMIWNDGNFSSSWTDVEIPLSEFAGHDISFSFEYSGTYAHKWYIKDVKVEEAIAQYTITANSNNNAWGTVSGGGTYNAGATCTLSATPASGYNFESWKKNGSVISTNPNYSFTVTETATYTAYFAETPINYYTITTNVTPAEAGTVTGGGTYEAGSSVTLTANANTGYTFSQWNDGNTQNPRTVTVSGDATYTAQFTQDSYTLTVTANPPAGGTATGGGTYHYGETATLTATANSGYEFHGWSDGSTENPHTVTVIGNATYTAIFGEVGASYFTVVVESYPAEGGTITGGGTYEAGTVITLTATPNTGYSFVRWSDGSTSNPRTVTVNGDMSFTAYFDLMQYTITVAANPSTGGTVSGGGSYGYGNIATLRATPYSGYEFVGWSDGSSENPHAVTVTGNATYTATFSQGGGTYYTVSGHVSPAGSGYVSGTGTYAAGTIVTLKANANKGYTFDHWNDGNTENPRTFTLNNNMSFTAYFTADQYTITANANPSNGGTVTGGGTYSFGATATLQASPNKSFTFVRWNDGDASNPRTVTVTEDATYTALFVSGLSSLFTVTVTSNDETLGTTSGSGQYPSGSSIQIRAIPYAMANFVKWSDGNTDNPRNVTVNSNMEFEAEFAAVQQYTIEVTSANPEMGNAYGGGTFVAGETAVISAQAFEGYEFVRWNDGNTENPRTITVTGNASYQASFRSNSVVTYNLTLICNTSEGTVSGGGIYVAGTTVSIQAFPKEGYVFNTWSDGSTSNPREVTINGDQTLVAFFTSTGVDEIDGAIGLYPNPATDVIRILGIEANSSIEIYNSIGELVKTVNASPDEEIGVKDLSQGLYLVRCGNATIRFVKTR